MAKKKIIIICFILFAIFLAFFIILYKKNQKTISVTNNTIANNPQLKASGTYDSRLSTIKEALMAKLSELEQNLIVNISQETPGYAKGVFIVYTSETEEKEIGESKIQIPKTKSAGIFLAKESKGSWEIVWSDQKPYSCQAVENYGFPESMINDCQK